MKKPEEGIVIKIEFPTADGIAAHISVILRSLKWQQIHYDTWEDPKGNTWELQTDYDKPVPMVTVIHAIIDSYREYMTTKAAKHFHGGSITGALCWQTILANNRTLEGKKKFPELPLLEHPRRSRLVMQQGKRCIR